MDEEEDYLLAQTATTIRMTPKSIASKTGDNTNHQDQEITLVNLRVMKSIVSSPTNPIPPLPEEPAIVFSFVDIEAARRLPPSTTLC